MIYGSTMILGAAIMFFFPIKGEQLVEFKEKIMVMHAEMKAELERIEGSDQAA